MLDVYTCTRRVAIAKAIASTRGGPLVNTTIIMMKAASNIVASFSNGCAVGTTSNRSLGFSCMNCRRRAIGISNHDIVGIGLSRNRLLSRIIIVNCNAIGGDRLANTITSISNGRLRTGITHDTSTTLRKEITNIAISTTGNRPKRNLGVGIHNVDSLDTADPLCIVSNICNSVGVISPTSVRSVRILGSTSTTTVCNSHTTGNIMLIAAGNNHLRASTHMAISTCANIRVITGCVSMVSNGRLHSLTGTANCDSTRKLLG